MFPLYQYPWMQKKKVVFSKPFYPTNDINKDFEFLKNFMMG